MISNMQHQQFESVAMEQILPQSTTTSVVVDTYVNNNNNNKMNKNIHLISPSNIIPFEDPDVIIFDAADIFEINSSSNTKEIITVATLPTIVATAPSVITTTTPRNLSSSNGGVVSVAVANKTATDTINNVSDRRNNLVNLTQSEYGVSQMTVVVDSSQSMIDDMMKDISNDFHSHEYALSSTERDGNTIARPHPVASTNRVCKKQKSVEEMEKDRREQEELQRQQSHIEDVHNYSKSPKSQMDESTNSSSEEDDDDDEDDDIDDMDDDVFHTSPKSSATTTISKGHVANKINVCDKSANKSTPIEKKQSQQLQQLQTNQSRRHTQSSSCSSSDEINAAVLPTATIKASPIASATTKLDSTTKSSTSPHNIWNATILTEHPATISCATGTLAATAYDVPDDAAEHGENCDGTNGGAVNGSDKLAPDHHARRPMNAFLIFCKRHRAIVRDKYKNLENRQITKILGEWWATLSNVEKACYTDLAKQYKDAFFKANPNFKWYKLPAPPLRTCTTRPDHSHSPTSPLALSNSAYSAHFINDLNNGTDDHDGGKNRYNCDNGYVRKSSFSFNYADIYSDSTSNVRNISNNSDSPFTPQKSALNAVGVFKLADEAQMGSLSMLCGHSGSSSASNSPNSESSGKMATSNDNNVHDELQNALGDASNFLSTTMRSCGTDSDPYQNMRDHANRMESNHVLNGKRKSSDETLNKWMPNKKPYSPTEGSERASRSCKGKRYQELMISGQIAPFGKKSTPKAARVTAINNSSLNGFYKGSADHMPDARNYHHHLALSLHNQAVQLPFVEDDKCEIIIPDRLHRENSATPPCTNQPQQQPDSPNSQKQFDASDFDLEEKIKALPAQCLESYLTRKRETKKKKKIGSKRRPASSASSSVTTTLSSKTKHHFQPSHPYLTPPKTIQEARERIQNAAVGSQKRKARKESITRRDVHTMNSATSSLLEAVGLVQLAAGGDTTIKIEYDPENCESSNQLIDGVMTIIKEEDGISTARIDCNGCMDNNSTPTSDLLILAEVATIAKSHI